MADRWIGVPAPLKRTFPVVPYRRRNGAVSHSHSRDRCLVSSRDRCLVTPAHGFQASMFRPLSSYSHPGEPPDFPRRPVQFDVSVRGGRSGRPSGDPDWFDITWVVVSSMGGHGGLLLERDRELQRVGECLQRAQQGRGGALVVEGPAGIGKTVLLAVARDAAGGEGFRVLRARGAELEREFAFGVVRQLFEPVVAGVSEEERAQLLDGAPQGGGPVLWSPGVVDGAATAAPIAPDPSFAVLHGLYWLCANLTTQHPLALVVDD